MKGERIYPEGLACPILQAGEYCLDKRTGFWFASAPNGETANLSKHNVVEHDDGTITVSPSILIKSTKGEELFHGFLEKGIWRGC